MKPAKQAVLKHMVSRDFIVKMLKGIVVHETSSASAGILENSMIYSIHSALYIIITFKKKTSTYGSPLDCTVVIGSGRSADMIHFQA